MRIAVNTRLLIKDKLDGIGIFTYETLRRITREHPEHEFVFLFDRPFSREFLFEKNVTAEVIGIPARHPLLFYLWFEWSVPSALKRLSPDVFVSPDGYLSLGTGVPSVAVIHDLNFEHHAFGMPGLIRRYYRYFFPRFARKAKRIGTVSGYSKNDICNTYGIHPGKVDVLYNGASDYFQPLGKPEQESARSKFTQGAPYFLFTGALHERKNIRNLVLAFSEFKKSTGSGHKLMLAGNRQWWTREMQEALDSSAYKSDIRFSGRLSHTEIAALTASAEALVYVPFFEGFGIPVVEAMSCGVPVIASNRTSLPEVCGDAALLVDPDDVQGIAGAMQKICSDGSVRAALIDKGRAQAAKFSWDKTAAAFWATIEKASGVS